MTRSRLSDPGIPHKAQPEGNAAQRATPSGITWGWFVDYGGNTGFRLRSAGGRTWPQNQVRMISGAFGHDREGFQKRPRPRVYAADGATVLSEGDAFAIDFLNGNPDLPILLGVARTLNPSDPDFFDAQPLGGDPDPIRFRAAQIDGSGAITGTLQVRALDGGTTFEIVVGGPTFGTGARLLIDYTAGKIKVGLGNETQPVPLGLEIMDALKQMITDITTIAGALPVPILPPALKSTLVLVDVETSTTGEGLPLLSPVVRVE